MSLYLPSWLLYQVRITTIHLIILLVKKKNYPFFFYSRYCGCDFIQFDFLFTENGKTPITITFNDAIINTRLNKKWREMLLSSLLYTAQFQESFLTLVTEITRAADRRPSAANVIAP